MDRFTQFTQQTGQQQNADMDELESIYFVLVALWKNECRGQELLQYQQVVVDNVIQYLQLNQQQQAETNNMLIKNMLKIQYNRISYVLSDYLRQRQLKIIKRQNVVDSRLSEAEIIYRNELIQLQDEIIDQEIFKPLENLVDLQLIQHAHTVMNDNISKADVVQSQPVFVKFIQQGQVNQFNCQEGDIRLFQFQDVHNMVDEGEAVLLK